MPPNEFAAVQLPMEQRVESLEMRVQELEKIIIAMASGQPWTIATNRITPSGHMLPVLLDQRP